MSFSGKLPWKKEEDKRWPGGNGAVSLFHLTWELSRVHQKMWLKTINTRLEQCWHSISCGSTEGAILTFSEFFSTIVLKLVGFLPQKNAQVPNIWRTVSGFTGSLVLPTHSLLMPLLGKFVNPLHLVLELFQSRWKYKCPCLWLQVWWCLCSLFWLLLLQTVGLSENWNYR